MHDYGARLERSRLRSHALSIESMPDKLPSSHMMSIIDCMLPLSEQASALLWRGGVFWRQIVRELPKSTIAVWGTSY